MKFQNLLLLCASLAFAAESPTDGFRDGPTIAITETSVITSASSTFTETFTTYTTISGTSTIESTLTTTASMGSSSTVETITTPVATTTTPVSTLSSVVTTTKTGNFAAGTAGGRDSLMALVVGGVVGMVVGVV